MGGTAADSSSSTPLNQQLLFVEYEQQLPNHNALVLSVAFRCISLHSVAFRCAEQHYCVFVSSSSHIAAHAQSTLHACILFYSRAAE